MPLPFQWRVTRYDHALRNEQGHYPLGDWSCFSDIGQIFNGKNLTFEQYRVYESAYAHSAVAFLTDGHLDNLRVVYLENKGVRNIGSAQLEGISLAPASLHKGSTVSRDNLADVVRLNLREVLWCKLEAVGRFYLHFGWDFYMYVGSYCPSIAAIRQSEGDGLFVEPMKSPYL